MKAAVQLYAFDKAQLVEVERRSKAQKLQGRGEGLTVRSSGEGMSRHNKRIAFVDPVSAKAHH